MNIVFAKKLKKGLIIFLGLILLCSFACKKNNKADRKSIPVVFDANKMDVQYYDEEKAEWLKLEPNDKFNKPVKITLTAKNLAENQIVSKWITGNYEQKSAPWTQNYLETRIFPLDIYNKKPLVLDYELKEFEIKKVYLKFDESKVECFKQTDRDKYEPLKNGVEVYEGEPLKFKAINIPKDSVIDTWFSNDIEIENKFSKTNDVVSYVVSIDTIKENTLNIRCTYYRQALTLKFDEESLKITRNGKALASGDKVYGGEVIEASTGSPPAYGTGDIWWFGESSYRSEHIYKVSLEDADADKILKVGHEFRGPCGGPEEVYDYFTLYFNEEYVKIKRNNKFLHSGDAVYASEIIEAFPAKELPAGFSARWSFDDHNFTKENTYKIVERDSYLGNTIKVILDLHCINNIDVLDSKNDWDFISLNFNSEKISIERCFWPDTDNRIAVKENEKILLQDDISLLIRLKTKLPEAYVISEWKIGNTVKKIEPWQYENQSYDSIEYKLYLSDIDENNQVKISYVTKKMANKKMVLNFDKEKIECSKPSSYGSLISVKSGQVFIYNYPLHFEAINLEKGMTVKEWFVNGKVMGKDSFMFDYELKPENILEDNTEKQINISYSTRKVKSQTLIFDEEKIIILRNHESLSSGDKVYENEIIEAWPVNEAKDGSAASWRFGSNSFRIENTYKVILEKNNILEVVLD